MDQVQQEIHQVVVVGITHQNLRKSKQEPGNDFVRFFI